MPDSPVSAGPWKEKGSERRRGLVRLRLRAASVAALAWAWLQGQDPARLGLAALLLCLLSISLAVPALQRVLWGAGDAPEASSSPGASGSRDPFAASRAAGEQGDAYAGLLPNSGPVSTELVSRSRYDRGNPSAGARTAARSDFFNSGKPDAERGGEEQIAAQGGVSAGLAAGDAPARGGEQRQAVRRLASRAMGAGGGPGAPSGAGVDFKGLSGLDNPSLNPLADFSGRGGGPPPDRVREAHSKLASKNLTSGINASKIMGQLKFAGARSRSAARGKQAEGAAEYGEHAFSQNVGGRTGRIRDPSGGGTAAPGAGSYQAGAGAGEQDGAPGSELLPECPEGHLRTMGGGCLAASIKENESEDATNYDALVRKAKDLIGEARKYTSRLQFGKAGRKAREAEAIGRRIKEEYGQSLQGQLIMELADKSDDFFHNYGQWWKDHAIARRKQQMDPKLDEDVHTAVGAEIHATYKQKK